MSEGTENLDQPLPAFRRARTTDSSLSLTDDGEQNGAGSAPAVEVPLREPSLALTDGTESPGRASLQELEERIRKLEAQYAVLQDTKVIEERVVQRINNRLRRKAPVTEIREAASLKEAEAPLPPPLEEPAMPVARALTAEEPAPAPLARPMEVPVAKVATAPVAPLSSPNIQVPAAVQSRFAWLLTTVWIFETLNEVRAMVRMFGDPRYRMGWLNRLIPVVFLGLFIFSDWESLKMFFPWNALPMVGWIINKLLLLILGYISFKILFREVRRYQETIPDAPGANRP